MTSPAQLTFSPSFLPSCYLLKNLTRFFRVDFKPTSSISHTPAPLKSMSTHIDIPRGSKRMVQNRIIRTRLGIVPYWKFFPASTCHENGSCKDGMEWNQKRSRGNLDQLRQSLRNPLQSTPRHVSSHDKQNACAEIRSLLLSCDFSMRAFLFSLFPLACNIKHFIHTTNRKCFLLFFFFSP